MSTTTMRPTTPVRSGGLRRRVAALALSGGVIAASLVVGTSPARADGCAAGVICGRVNNTTGYTMHTTDTLWEGPNRCDVWNRDKGDSWNWEQVNCTQSALGSYSVRGGFGNDVDAFTFNYRGYYVGFNAGGERWVDKGVWTRMSTLQTTTCSSVFGSAPHCRVMGPAY